MSGKFRLTKNQLEIITQTVLKEIQSQTKNQQKQDKDWRLRNTKLLLENYHRLKDHCDDINQQAVDYEETIYSLEELTLETLMKYRLKTAKMMRHFDRMLKYFAEDCENGNEEDHRKFKVIYHRYLKRDKTPVKDLCDELGVEQATIYRDTKRGINDISVLLFGISALDTSRF